MPFPIALLLFLILVVLVLFTLEPWPADVIALGLMVTLILTGLLPPEEAFKGFGSDTILLLLGLLILTAALIRTGVVDVVGREILRRAGDNPNRLLLAIMVTVTTLSAIMSNTAATALFVPIVLGLARRTHTSPSKLLMPLAFASILSSPVTLVSSTSNIVISGLLTRAGLPPIGMFEMAPVGVPITIVGVLYMFWLGRRMIPERIHPDETQGGAGTRSYFTEIQILPQSSLIGKTIPDTGLVKELGITVIQIFRDDQPVSARQSEFELQPGDVLLVEGQGEELIRVKDTTGIDLKTDVKFSSPDRPAEEAEMVEAIILPRSPLIGRTLERLHFRQRYGLQVVGISRGGETITDKISDTRLRVGDQLLLQGNLDALEALEDNRMFRVIGSLRRTRPNLPRAPLSIAIFIGALGLATFNILSLPVAVLLGTIVAFVTRSINPEEAYREVEWRALVLIGSMLALGAAMEHTGAAQYLAGEIVALVGRAGPIWLLTGFFVLTLILTQPMSNQAAAIVVIPVALQTASQLGLNPRTFAMMIAVAASCSYLTPLEPSNLMVYGPGRYKFVDFLKVGSLLTVLIYLISIFLVPLIWPVQQ